MAVTDFLQKGRLRRAKAIERGLKMVPILIHLPPPSSDTVAGNRDVREVMREKTAQAEVLYNLIAGTATEGFKSNFYGQRHVALELVASGGVVHFYAAVPVALVSVVKKAVLTAYPGAQLEEVEDHNIFNQEGRLAATMGGEMVLRAESAYPIATYEQLERDPMEALLTTFSALGKKDGVAIQLMIRPAAPDWTKKSVALADGKRKGRATNLSFSAQDLVKAAVKAPSARRDEERAKGVGADISNLELQAIEAIEEKTKHPGFEILIRVMVSTESVARSQQLLRDISTAFALFDQPGLNGFKFLPALDVQGLVTAFIFRFFPIEIASNVLNSAELATLFHLPDSQFTPSASVERQQSKQVDGPVSLPTVGLLFGYNEFRGVRKEIRLDNEDRRRHTYILGQTGTGKSTMLENLAVQDMVNGNGFAFIDPHGDSAEKLLAMVPKERAEDIIYFNPADTEYPLGLNLFEFSDPTQKDFIVQETINMLYKLYDPGHTGIIGPRYEHWYRNAALTLMSDPNGSTFIEIPKVFTDTEYLKKKFRYLKDPTVIDFWTKEMGQTSDYHKSEMLGWFVSKFGAFVNNEMMRNIIGQTKSSFNLRDVMDHKKILIVNLSKGRIGDLNSQLLGMIFVIKFQAAAMSRAEMPETERSDFCLYVDEFQNFSTDSFAGILSEARKYRLNLIVANQFIGQLRPEIREAVFGNIGTIVAHRMGPEDAEFMVKQFAPVFDVTDLVNLPNFNAAMRLMVGGLPSQPFSVRDSAPLGKPNVELGLAVKQLSAAKFGRTKAVVEAEILDRLAGEAGAAPAPRAVETPAVGAAGSAPEAAVPATAEPVVAPAPVPPPVQAAPGVMAMAGVMGAPMANAVAAMGPSGAQLMQPPPAAVAAPVLQGMASTPPPIGAPPVGVEPAAAAVDAAGAVGQSPTQATAIIPEANIDASADEVVQQGGYNQMGAPVSAASLTAAPAGGGTVPPPIGAPPVDLPGSAPAPIVQADVEASIQPAAPVAASAALPPVSPPSQLPQPAMAPSAPAPQTMPLPQPVPPAGSPDPLRLSLSDITGGKQLPKAVPDLNPADVQLMPPGAEPPAPLQQAAVAPTVVPPPLPAPPVQAPALPPLGSGEPLEGDPYANIDVLGDLTPPEPVGQSQGVDQPTGLDAQALAATGEPLPNDPYANIDVMGAAPGSVVPGLASEQAAGVAELSEDEQALPEAELPVAAAPMPRPMLQPTAPAPEVQVLPAASMPAPVPVVATEQVAVPVKPLPEPVVPASAAQEPAVVEPMIHFVDPAAEKLLAQPDTAQNANSVDDLQQQMMAGLPQGVTFVQQPAAASTPPAPRQAPAPPAPVASVAPAAPVPQPATPAPTSAPPVIMGGPGVPALATQLDKMAVEPPPIGAPPVATALVPVQQPPAPAPAVTAAGVPPMPAPSAVPETNLSLAEALEKLPQSAPARPPEASVPVAGQASAAPAAIPPADVDKSLVGLESVADMLEEAKAAEPQKPVGAPAPQAAPEPAVEAKPAQPPVPPAPLPAIGPVRMDQQPPAAAPAASAGAQIEKTESEIDGLLSQSLIRDDGSSHHRRLPEPVVPAGTENETGVDLELNAASATRPVAPPAPAAQAPAAEHHGLKVIQPLEPIVPPKEAFAKELAELNRQEQQGAAAKTGQTPRPPAQTAAAQTPAQAPASVRVPVAPAAPAPATPAAVPAVSAAVVPVPQHTQPAIVKHLGEMLGLPPASQVGVAAGGTDDGGLPQAESLAANDVAKARAEHEAQVTLHPEAAKVQTPAPADQKTAEHGSAKAAPATQPEQPKPRRSRSSSRRHRDKDDASERIESEAEAEHNKPTAAETEAGALTGTLIMPSGEKLTAEPEQPKLEKPKKLAPGEVFVDEHGNVMVGE